jgi:ureidoglycolate hydrolase
MRTIPTAPLTRAAFAPFGEVVDAATGAHGLTTGYRYQQTRAPGARSSFFTIAKISLAIRRDWLYCTFVQP